MKTETNKYPCEFIVHWATGQHPCCEKHKNGLLKLGIFLGTHVPVSINTDINVECENCKNEIEV